MNFKGLSSCRLEAGKRSIDISEGRALGKTMRSASLQRMLADKDSAECTDVELKTLRSDETTIPMPGLGDELANEHKDRLATVNKPWTTSGYFPGNPPWREPPQASMEQRADFTVVQVMAALAPRNFAGRRRRTWRIGGWWPSPSRFRMKPIRSGILRRFCLHG